MDLDHLAVGDDRVRDPIQATAPSLFSTIESTDANASTEPIAVAAEVLESPAVGQSPHHHGGAHRVDAVAGQPDRRRRSRRPRPARTRDWWSASAVFPSRNEYAIDERAAIDAAVRRVDAGPGDSAAIVGAARGPQRRARRRAPDAADGPAHGSPASRATITSTAASPARAYGGGLRPASK